MKFALLKAVLALGFLCQVGILGCGPATQSLDRYYTGCDENAFRNLREYRQRNTVRPKTILNLGDSISFSDCFVWPERTRLSRPGMLSSEGYIYAPKEWGASSGKTSDWGLSIVNAAIQRANPEIVTILLGTNDLLGNDADAVRYQRNMAGIINACLANKTIPIVLTIPPARGIDPDRLSAYNGALIELARLKQLPVIHTDRLFNDHGGWRALCPDGVHPDSGPDGSGGYDLINRVFREVYEKIEREVIGRSPPHFEKVLLATERREQGEVVEIYDRNGDGKPDLWIHRQPRDVVIEEYDSDFDGRIDVRWQFDRGWLVSGEEDLARSGKLDTPFKMRDGWKNETP